jgi:hypothetical protein
MIRQAYRLICCTGYSRTKCIWRKGGSSNTEGAFWSLLGPSSGFIPVYFRFPSNFNAFAKLHFTSNPFSFTLLANYTLRPRRHYISIIHLVSQFWKCTCYVPEGSSLHNHLLENLARSISRSRNSWDRPQCEVQRTSHCPSPLERIGGWYITENKTGID